MEVICIDDKFDQRSVDLIPKRPIKDKIYNIREIIKTSDGRIGVLLEEIINQPIEMQPGHYAEPRFNINRFSHLSGDFISKEEITEFLREEKKKTNEALL